MVSEDSNTTPRLRAEIDGVIVTLESMRRTASEILESCLGKANKQECSFRLIERETID